MPETDDSPRKVRRPSPEAEERFALAARGAHDGLWDWDLENEEIYFSPRWNAMLGGREEETTAEAETWLRQVHPDDRSPLEEAIAGHLDRRTPLLAHEYRIRHHNGTWHWMLIRGTAVWDAAGRAYRMAGSQTDVTRQKRAEEELRRSSDELRVAIEQQRRHHREIVQLNEMSDLLLTCRDLEETYPVISQFAGRLFPGLSGSVGLIDVTGRTVETVTTWGEALSGSSFATQSCRALRQRRPHDAGASSQGSRCDHFEEPYPASHMCIPMTGSGEMMGHLVLALPAAELGSTAILGGTAGELPEDMRRLAVTVADHVALSLSNQKMQESLRRQAIRDPLTQLYNRRFTEESLERELRRARRREFPLGLVTFDVDHFAQLSADHGRSAGDDALRQLGQLLAGRLRTEDIACRYGGAKFLLVLPDTPESGCRQLAEDLRQEVGNLQFPGFSVAASFGVAAFPVDGETADEILRAADRALHDAKEPGRDRVAVASDR